MNVPNETTPRELLSKIEKLTTHLQQLEQLAQQSVQALVQQGYKLKIDVNALVNETEAALRNVKQDSQQVAHQVEQFQELIRTSALITSSLELDRVLEDVMDTVISLTGAERAYLMLSHEDELSIRAARNWDKETLNEQDATFSRGIVTTAMESGQPLLTTNAQADARFQQMASVMANALRSIIVIPLMLQGRAIGVLYADNRMHHTVFNQNSIPLLTAFANQATIAIENARLFEKVKDDLKQAQREVQRLRIEVDQRRVKTQVGEITESDYFQSLSTMAKDMRKRGKDEGQGESSNP